MSARKNIEAVCACEAEIGQQIRQTVVRELSHYFGITKEQLRARVVMYSCCVL